MGRHAWSLLIIRHSRQLSKPREAWCSKKPRTAHFIFCVNCEILQNMTLSAYWRVSPPKKERKKSEFPGILERLLHTPSLQKEVFKFTSNHFAGQFILSLMDHRSIVDPLFIHL